MALHAGDEPEEERLRSKRAEILHLMLRIEAKLDVLRQSPEAHSIVEEIDMIIRDVEKKLREHPPSEFRFRTE